MTVEITYSISEVSKILERSVYWLRWKEGKLIKEGSFVREDGSPIEIARSLSVQGGSQSHARRKYTIQNIEDMADLFLNVGVYSDREYDRINKRVESYKQIGKGAANGG